MSVEISPAPDLVEDDYRQYKALSTLAVVSFAAGVLSVLTFVGWSLAAIPMVGIVAGLLAVRQIRATPDVYTGEHFALVGTLLCGLLWTGGWSRLAYVHATEVPPGYERISYDDLQVDEAQPNTFPPARAVDLDGKKVFIKGYVYQPTGGQTSGLTRFILVRDKGQCCFGGNPKITDMIEVKLKRGLEAEFNMQVRKLAGTFRIGAGQGIDGLTGALYHLDADHLE
ncbi:MAG TPA: DUF4190 domain-containing protein [Pirellulales bacterium]|nr:DUF4190 domain-containing protein [Pirellulales bacterium]